MGIFTCTLLENPIGDAGAAQLANALQRNITLNKNIPEVRHRVMLLGDVAVGKTFVYRHLQDQLGRFDRWFSSRDPTDAIHCSSLVDTKLSQAHVQLSLWDFAGDEHYRASHQLYLSSDRTTYLVVFKVDDTSGMRSVGQWLESIVMRVGRARVTMLFVVILSIPNNKVFHLRCCW